MVLSFNMDSAAVKFGAVSLGLGLLSFVVLVAVWGGVGPCTDMRQLMLLILALAGILIGAGTLLISLPVVVVQRHRAHKVRDVGSLSQIRKKTDSF
jgi:hypothetical protein